MTMATAATATIPAATAAQVVVEFIAFSRTDGDLRTGLRNYVGIAATLRKSSMKRRTSRRRVSSSGARSNAEGCTVASA